MNKKTYYCNKPCKIIADLRDEAVIEILTSLVYGVDEIGYEECYDEYSKIIVNKKYLFKNKIDIEGEFISMSSKLEKKEREVNQKIREEERELNKKIKEQRDTLIAKSKQFEGFETMFKYFDGTIKYVLYNNKLKKLDEIFSNYDETQLASVSFRAKDNKSIQMYIGQYYDYSGSNYEAIGFESFKEAKAHITKNLNDTVESLLEETERGLERQLSFYSNCGVDNNNVKLLREKLLSIRQDKKEAIRKKLKEELAEL